MIPRDHGRQVEELACARDHGSVDRRKKLFGPD